MTQATNKLLTFEEFLEYDDGTDNLYELVDGQVVPMSEPSGPHESISSFIYGELYLEIRLRPLNLELHPKTLCKLSDKDGRRPDLLIVDKAKWVRNTAKEAALKEPPELVIEIVLTNWEDDYQKKPLWYAAFGVPEYWIVDPFSVIDRYPNRRNPTIQVPTVSVLILGENKKYQTRQFTGSERIESQLLPEIALTVDQILAAS